MATKKTSPKKTTKRVAVTEGNIPVPVGQDPKMKTKAFGKGFMDFIRQYHVVPLAIAVVLGNAVNDVVKVLVEGIITPFISLVVPSTSLQNYEWTFRNSTFSVGAVISALITFIVVAFVIYVFVKKFLKDDSVLQKQ